MKEKIIAFIEEIKKNTQIMFIDESATKQSVILKLLSILHWDIFNIEEVKPEYSVGSDRVDYSLRCDNKNKVFLEVKRPKEVLEEHEKQLLGYAFKEGVKIAILTNGITWWFYLPLHEGSWEQRKFYTIDILQQELLDISSKFIDFLSMDNIKNEKAVQNAETIYKSRKNITMFKETMPKAWNKIIETPDDLLVDLITDTTEKLCGFKEDNELVRHFLSEYKGQLMVSVPAELRPSPTGSKKMTDISENYIGKSISSFSFKGIEYRVRFWKDMLIKLCEIIQNDKKDKFNELVDKRPYISRDKNKFTRPYSINDTDIFVEMNRSAEALVKMCYEILSLSGYSKSDLKIEVSN